MATKTCFLICPIGDEGSDIRKAADDLMDLIVIPALERFDFEVIRADKIPRPSVITTDIIQLVQNAALCIIDLTGSNPNVFYESGRRHETGRPFIQLIAKGERLPFDVSGIRTIQYDLSTVRSAHATIKEIQNYVSELSTSDFSTGTAGESLSSLASAIQRIERKLDSVATGASSREMGSGETEFLEKLRIEANPRRAFQEAVGADQMNKARMILPVLHAKLGNTDDVLIAAMIFARAGDPAAADLCVKILETPSEPIEADTLRNAIRSLFTYYDLVDGEKYGVKALDPIIQAQVKRDDIDNQAKAYILNQLQKLLYATGQYEYALTIIEQAIDFDPDGAYSFNKGLLHDKLGMKAKAAESMDSYLKLVGQDREVMDLARIALIYQKAERIEDAKKILATMKDIDPRRTEEFLDAYEELKSLLVT
jgi:tetratricopeptide (TPR) repeat protein